MNNKQIVSLVVALALGGAGGFFGGIKYQQSKDASARQQFTGRFNTAGNMPIGQAGQGNIARRVNGNGGFAAGEVLNKDDKSLTIKMPDGGSKIVFYSESTQISKPAPILASDLKTGENVVISGSQNSDGSITAQTIQIREEMQTTPLSTPGK